MTVFDRLEAQLADAHPQRNRRALPRPAPRTVLAVAAAVAAVVVVTVAALAGGSSTQSAGPAAQPPGAVAPVARGATTVAVLNDTRRPGVAGRFASVLARRGWKIGTVTNGPDQSLDSSCVDFTPGHSQAASIIAKQLGIYNVLPVSEDLKAAAGPDADVVVVVGTDRAG
jgi:LytR cell envelope-related transcriptional attenuator